MSQTELLKKYNLDERNLQALFNNIEIYLNEKHIEVIYRNLEEAIEIDVYKIDRAFKNANKHHETCLSNGIKVWLHDNLDEVGGIAGRLYDALHVGCGHVWQWGSDETNGLQF